MIRRTAKTIINYNLIEHNDRVLIAFSGGKDSGVMCDLLKKLHKKAPIQFELALAYIGEATQKMEKLIASFGLPWEIIPFQLTDQYDKNKGACPICARLRRGYLYQYAKENHFNKIALGHHLDDVLQTALLNQFYQAKIWTLKPVYRSDDEYHTIIRPLHSVLESDIIHYMQNESISVYENSCPYEQHKNKERENIKKMLSNLPRVVKYNIYNSFTKYFV